MAERRIRTVPRIQTVEPDQIPNTVVTPKRTRTVPLIRTVEPKNRKIMTTNEGTPHEVKREPFPENIPDEILDDPDMLRPFDPVVSPPITFRELLESLNS
ncbi:hypothetical protein A2W45_03415 [Candidatus Curtissbacteria bacterium RIFCSPHIGHO2_12_41_11]|uniref:Uncharacterized protein n=2 Tax=Candidatus Curtissiibacteriota TaxID=1752717 RepID=A0A1F5HTA7_9BACT|nr:MAG: hypothetical protein A2W45_03415 [Candidatus Curtissbacteria bacterium RIFCSPHIGHO2_12_41_11]OGE07377.1 MAG: hypothetical protein A2W70_03230 [Candidatus Curtissbacteria bacterium RIFCSPLOWO2_02_41_11]